MRNGLTKYALLVSIVGVLVFSNGCGSSDNSGTEDTSTSGSVASVVAGAENGSNTSTGTQALNDRRLERLFAELELEKSAEASNTCSYYTTAERLACSEGTAQSPITYSDCSFSGSSAVWNGGVSLTCASGSITRIVNDGTTRMNSFGRTLTIHTSAATGYSGSGFTLSGSGGTTWTASNLTINGVELVTDAYDHTLQSSTLTRSVSGAGSSQTVTYSGTVTLYHNKVKITATSQLTGLTLTPGSCCMPTGGTITTTFSGTSLLGSKYDGATETLQFTGCGTATYSGPEGYSGTVSVTNCI